MVSWVRALKAATLTIAYWILWGIAGGLLILGGIFSMSEAISINTSGIPTVDLGRAFGGIILAIIGYLIIMLGFYATIYKIGAEVVAEEVKGKQITVTSIQPSVILCKSCGFNNPIDAKFCIKCGAKLE